MRRTLLLAVVGVITFISIANLAVLWVSVSSVRESVYEKSRILLDTDSINISQYNKMLTPDPAFDLQGKDSAGQVPATDIEHLVALTYGRRFLLAGGSIKLQLITSMLLAAVAVVACTARSVSIPPSPPSPAPVTSSHSRHDELHT